jgi:hypothetical protein
MRPVRAAWQSASPIVRRRADRDKWAQLASQSPRFAESVEHTRSVKTFQICKMAELLGSGIGASTLSEARWQQEDPPPPPRLRGAGEVTLPDLCSRAWAVALAFSMAPLRSGPCAPGESKGSAVTCVGTPLVRGVPRCASSGRKSLSSAGCRCPCCSVCAPTRGSRVAAAVAELVCRPCCPSRSAARGRIPSFTLFSPRRVRLSPTWGCAMAAGHFYEARECGGCWAMLPAPWRPASKVPRIFRPTRERGRAGKSGRGTGGGGGRRWEGGRKHTPRPEPLRARRERRSGITVCLLVATEPRAEPALTSARASAGSAARWGADLRAQQARATTQLLAALHGRGARSGNKGLQGLRGKGRGRWRPLLGRDPFCVAPRAVLRLTPPPSLLLPLPMSLLYTPSVDNS